MKDARAALTACAGTLVVLAGIEGWIRGVSPARLATLTLLVLLAGLFPLRLVFGRARPVPPAADGIAGAVVLWLAGVSAYWLRDTWAILTLRPTGIAALLVAIATGTLLFAVLRRSAAPLVARTPSGLRRFAAATTLVLVTAALLGSIRPPAKPPDAAARRDGRPNVVLVTIETLRADHLSAYGYREHRTPNLDRVAAGGARFDAAFAPAPWTLATLASLMTSHYPSVLGIDRRTGVPPDMPTLAATLASAGYRTHAIVTNVYAYRNFGLNAGFQGYEHLHDLGLFDDLEGAPLYVFLQRARTKLVGRHADRLTRLALGYLTARAKEPGTPFFLWLHYYDPHQPYGENSEGDLPCESREAPEIGGFFNDARRVIHGERTLTPAQQRHLVHLYDSDIRFLDREIGALFDALDRAPFADDTLLVVTSDHGEEFWDHGGYEHGHSLHHEVTRVPLLVRWPGRVEAGTVIPGPVSLLDVMPTILEAAAVASPPVQGVPLGLSAAVPGRDAPALSENIHYGPEQKAARDATRSVLVAPSAGEVRVFDRVRDPGETDPLPPAEGEAVLAWIDRQGEANTTLRTALGLEGTGGVALTRFQKEQLRSLGYVVD